MPSVTFATYCHPPHLAKLHAPGVLEEMIGSHQHLFNEILVVHQRCRGIPYRPLDHIQHRVLESEDYYPQIFDRFGIDLHNPIARRDCHGESAAHWHAWHTLNHLIVLEEAISDYVVFSDCDCVMVSSDPMRSWITEAIDILETWDNVFIVGPGDGGSMAEARLDDGRARLTRNVSQQLFIAKLGRIKNMEWDIPWNWEKLAPGEPMAEFYWMAEGRIWRHLDKHGLWRAILPDAWRYWHYNPWEPQGWIDAGRPE